MRIRNILCLAIFAGALGACSTKTPDEPKEEGPRVYDVGNGKVIYTASWSPDGKILLIGGEDKIIRMLQPALNSIVWESNPYGGSVLSSAFSDDGEYFLVGIGDNGARTGEVVLRKTDGRERVWNLDNLQYDQAAVAISHEKKLVAVASYHDITLYDFQTGKRIETFAGHEMDEALPTGHTGAVSSIQFTSDDEILVSVAWDDNVKLWEIKNGKEAGTFIDAEPINDLVLTKDDRYAISGGGDIKMWNLQTGQADHVFDHRNVEALAISSDGRYLASGCALGIVTVWSLDSKEKVNKYTDVHKKGVWALAFSPDGKSLASAGGDGIVKIAEFVPAVDEQKSVEDPK